MKNTNIEFASERQNMRNCRMFLRVCESDRKDMGLFSAQNPSCTVT